MCVCMHVCVLRRFSCVRLFVTLWAVAHHTSLSMGFSRQEYQSGLPCPPPGVLPDPGIEPASLMSPARAGELFYYERHLGSPKSISLDHKEYEETSNFMQ